MLLLNADIAIIAREKLQYLLDPSHPENRGKYRVFQAIGYSLDGWQDLERDFREQFLTLDALPGRPSPHGENYEILGTLQGTSGKANMKTIWMFRKGEQFPRFVTAYPFR